jgi:hypothetical protein
MPVKLFAANTSAVVTSGALAGEKVNCPREKTRDTSLEKPPRRVFRRTGRTEINAEGAEPEHSQRRKSEVAARTCQLAGTR